jgi:protein-L-isoaspartate(D-aspartate) O-methyltransferase
MTPDIDFEKLREKMVDGQLRTTDVTDRRLLAAMRSVPREAFVPPQKCPIAYIDEDLEIAPPRQGRPARYLMEPSPFARLVQLARVGPEDVVLDVGCATGYSTAVLSRLAGSVIALESDPELAAQASETLSRLGFDNAVVVEGALPEGYPDEAPYDVILLGGVVDFVPGALLDQLKDGGRLVCVEGRGNAASARLYLREGDLVSSRRAFNAAVQPLPGFERAPEFDF